MQIDIAVVVYHVLSGTKFAGFISAEPVSRADNGDAVTEKDGRDLIAALQKVLGEGRVEQFTLFTRSRERLSDNLGKDTFKDREAIEITIPPQILLGSVFSMQLVKVPQ
jgi:hypothetical protein